MVWAIASDENREEDAARFAEALDLQVPVLYDEGGLVHEDYSAQAAGAIAPYPQEWIVGTDGVIVYYANHYDYSAVTEVIEAELAGR